MKLNNDKITSIIAAPALSTWTLMTKLWIIVSDVSRCVGSHACLPFHLAVAMKEWINNFSTSITAVPISVDWTGNKIQNHQKSHCNVRKKEKQDKLLYFCEG